MRMVYFDSIYNQCTVDTVSYSTLVYSCSSQHFLPPLALSRTPRLRSRFIPSAFKPPSVALGSHAAHTYESVTILVRHATVHLLPALLSV
jgi:hypothetical protein